MTKPPTARLARIARAAAALAAALWLAADGTASAQAAGDPSVAAGSPTTPTALPRAVSLQAEYLRLGLPTQAQQGDTCWAYSVVGCLELEVSRAQGKAVQLSAPYLVWAASRADRAAFDRRGSNFGRAARALAMYGVCELRQVPVLDTADPRRTIVPDPAVAEGARTGQGLEVHWIRFWQPSPGLDDGQLLSIKQFLATGHPVAVGLRWPKETAVEDQLRCLLKACGSLDDTFDGHCVTLVGYEDNPQEPGGGSFLFRNTWGDQWMDRGFARISYGHVRRFTNDALALTVRSDAPHRLRPRLSAPSNVTAEAVLDLHRGDCKAAGGLTVADDDIARMQRGVWQGNDQVFCTAERAGGSLTIRVTPSAAGPCTLVVAGTRAPDYGIYAFLVDGKRVGKPCDLSWPDVEPTGPLALGDVFLGPGPHELRVECIGKSPASTGFLLGLDWVALRPRP